MLNLEPMERFKIIWDGNVEKPDHTYYFSNDDFWSVKENGSFDHLDAAITLVDIISGKVLVKKIPWIPRDQDVFYYPVFDSENNCVLKDLWNDSKWQKILYYNNLAFRSRSEAEKAYEQLLYQAKLMNIEQKESMQKIETISDQLI